MTKLKLSLVTILMTACMLAGCGSATNTATSSVENESTDAITEQQEKETETALSEETTETTTLDEESAAEEDVVKEFIPESFACAITITINPQITLYLDEANTIIGVRFDNQDAKDAYEEIELMGKGLEESVNLLVDTAIEKEYLKEDGAITVTLAEIGDTTAVTDDSVLQDVKNIVEEHLETIELFNTDSESEAETGSDESADNTEKKHISLETEVSSEITNQYGIEKTKTLCVACNGTGIYCPGDPSFGKSRGNGNGYAGCNGTGYSACPDIHCNNGNYTDPNCGGSGKQNCFGCNGTGLEDNAACKHCGGTGKITCEYCGGKGAYPHHEFCMGTGIAECITKDLHSACSTCGGTGYVE